MKVEKEALGGQRVEPTEEELALVNRQSRQELTAGSLTTGGAPAVRRPASTGRKWSGRRGYARRWESPPAI